MNWQITVTRDRIDAITRYELNWLEQVEQANYSRTWPSQAWYRNGVYLGPFFDFSTPILDTLQLGQIAQFEADYTIHVEWVGVGDPPSTATIVINSPAQVWYSNAGTGSINNGVGGTVATINASIGGYSGKSRYITDPQVVRVVQIDPQTGIGELEFTANLSVSNPSGESSGYIWPWLGDVSAWFNVRTAFVYLEGGGIPMNRKLTGDDVTATIFLTQDGVPMSVANNAFSFFDDLDQAYNGSVRTYDYPGATQEQAEILFGAEYTNYSSWHLGLPRTPQNRYTMVHQGGFVWYDPDPLEFDVPFAFYVSPAGNMLAAWQLTGRTELDGDENDLTNGWFSWETTMVPPALVRYMRQYETYTEGPDGLVHVDNDGAATDTIVLTASFTDDITATSIRSIQYHPNLELVSESTKKWVDFEVNKPYWLVDIGPTGGGLYNDRVVPEDTSAAVIYPDKYPYWYFFTESAVDLTFFILQLIPSSPIVDVVLDLLATGVGEILGELPDVPASATHIYRDTTYISDQCDSLYVDGFGTASWQDILNGEDREEWAIEILKEALGNVLSPYWYWSTVFRPGSERQFQVYDEWGLSGFVHRTHQEKSVPKMVGSDRFGFFYMSYSSTPEGIAFPGV